MRALVGVLALVLAALAATPRVSAEDASVQTVEQTSVSPTRPSSVWNPFSWKWTPTDEELMKYRRSWNPMANGPILNTGVDVQPQGQFLAEPFVFGEFGHQQYGNQLSTSSKDSPHHLQAIAPTLIFAYGITNNLEIDVIPGFHPLVAGQSGFARGEDDHGRIWARR